MPGQVSFIALVKIVLWLVVVAVATWLLRRRRVSRTVRIGFLLGGTLTFGFLFGALAPGATDPNPVFSVRNLLRMLLAPSRVSAGLSQQAVLGVAGMLVALLATVWVSNKSICGWGCPLGLLQDLVGGTGLRGWKPPFWLANGVRLVGFASLLGGLGLAGVDWIGWLDPFRIFGLDVTVLVGGFGAALLVASLFIYRPWCQFLCPFSGRMGRGACQSASAAHQPRCLPRLPALREGLSHCGHGGHLYREEDPCRLLCLWGLHSRLPTTGGFGLARTQTKVGRELTEVVDA